MRILALEALERVGAALDEGKQLLSTILSTQTMTRNHIVGLWAYAYMNGELDRLPLNLSITTAPTMSRSKRNPGTTHKALQEKNDAVTKEMESLLYETALLNRFGV